MTKHCTESLLNYFKPEGRLANSKFKKNINGLLKITKFNNFLTIFKIANCIDLHLEFFQNAYIKMAREWCIYNKWDKKKI